MLGIYCQKNIARARSRDLHLAPFYLGSTAPDKNKIGTLPDHKQAVRGKSHERVPAGSDHFLCLTDPLQLVVSFPCVRK